MYKLIEDHSGLKGPKPKINHWAQGLGQAPIFKKSWGGEDCQILKFFMILLEASHTQDLGTKV